MGLLTVLKKMKQKEKEMRILMLYPFKLQEVKSTDGPWSLSNTISVVTVFRIMCGICKHVFQLDYFFISVIILRQDSKKSENFIIRKNNVSFLLECIS